MTLRPCPPCLAATVVLITEAGQVGSHVTWSSPWWREPLLWSDRWHLLSAAAHWPAALLILWLAVPAGRWGRIWIGLGAASAGIWWAVKALAGKGWPMWWMQAAGWIGGG